MPVGEKPDLSGLTPPIVGGYPTTEFFPRAYAFHDGAHWLVEPLPTGDNMTTYPGTATATAINVHRIDSLGVETIYPVELPIWFQWGTHSFGFVHDLCTISYQLTRLRWHAGIGGGDGVPFVNFDAQLASDGTTLWLGVICKQEDPYPWYFSHYHIPFMDPTTLETFSAAGNYFNYQGSLFCAGSGSPWDDFGPSLSQRWSPYRLLMFAFDGGSFTQIGEVGPAYTNDGLTFPGDGSAGVSGVEMCASPAEPGVCHAVWAEFGQYGQRDMAPPNGPWPYRGSRLNYSAWNNAGQIVEGDLLRYEGILDIGPYPPPNRPAGVGWLNPSRNVGGSILPWALPMTEATFAWTPVFALRNDHGSPVLFISFLKVLPDGSAPDNNDWQIRMWDISSGSGVQLQELTSDLLPQPVETQYVHVGGGGGFTVDRIPTISGVSSGAYFNDREGVLSVSRLYDDPLLGGQAVYLIGVVFTGAGQRVEGFYRVPCDGSGPFTVLDGDRNLGILPNVNHQRFLAPIYDFFSDPKAVWIPGGSLGLTELDRVCAKDWVNTKLGTSPDFAICPRSGAYDDAIASKFYYAATSNITTNSDVGQTKIVPDLCGPAGIHIWDLPPGHR